uniref:Uncharacterized protein n=1 Tax=Anas platyrhynchos TaxID=8839 RepID=A0A8B9SMC7_ANAPL
MATECEWRCKDCFLSSERAYAESFSCPENTAEDRNSAGQVSSSPLEHSCGEKCNVFQGITCASLCPEAKWVWRSPAGPLQKSHSDAVQARLCLGWSQA